MHYYTYKLNLWILNVLALVLLSLMIIFHYFLVGNIDFLVNIDAVPMLIMLLLWFVLHEILHGIGFLSLGKVKFKSVVFGAELENGIFYCMCKEKISKTNILISLLFPLAFIGVLTYFLGLYLKNDLLIILSVVNISGSIGDIVMALDLFLMPRDVMYLDLDDPTSFTILSKERLEQKKYFGIELHETGDYSKKICPSDYTKLKISKASIWILLVVLMIIFIFIGKLFVD